ncbi:uncharacterized protein LOC127703924 [Mytilus californianus]|uniref:uncharacterized protein LOC127703924 n=1 Tax=Mytilus californianus TaxID=6549 RepID=UPI002245167E|nr:uncharacterized protein LOC127703924 [Mytilus californianus]
MMSNIVMARMNLKGKKNKIAFLKTKLYKVISVSFICINPPFSAKYLLCYLYFIECAKFWQMTLFTIIDLKYTYFKTYHDVYVFTGCVMMVYPEITETKVKEDIGKFLKYAPERAGGGGRTSKD